MNELGVPTPGNTHPVLPLRPTLLSKAHMRQAVDEGVHGRRVFTPVSEFVVVPATKIVTAALGRLPMRSTEQPARSARLRASYDRRNLHVVKPSALRGRGELRASTPPHFRAASVMTDAGAGEQVFCNLM